MNPGAVLHARSRGLYPAGTALISIAVLLPLLGRALVHLSTPAGDDVMFNLVVLGCAAAVAVLSKGLAGADPELEASTTRSGLRLRLAHLLLALLVVAGLLLLGFLLLPKADSGLTGPEQVEIIVRDVAGLFGLQALAAALLGARFSWGPPALWVLMLVPGAMARHGWRIVASMPKMPPHTPGATITAVVLLAAGLAAYAANRVAR